MLSEEDAFVESTDGGSVEGSCLYVYGSGVAVGRERKGETVNGTCARSGWGSRSRWAKRATLVSCFLLYLFVLFLNGVCVVMCDVVQRRTRLCVCCLTEVYERKRSKDLGRGLIGDGVGWDGLDWAIGV